MNTAYKKYPIDIVIPWVDGNDPNWIAEKNKYYKGTEKSVHKYDYQDWDLLRYFFRGIERFAPWVNKVFFITWGHVPKWLNENHPKLRIINHRDYIPEKYLPTFSSHTIELNLHRIPELSEHFIYFNDDMFLINRCSPELFFYKGLPRDSAIINPIAPANNNCISSLQLTTIAVINENFGKHAVIKRSPLKWFNIKYGKLLPLNFMFIPWGRFPGLLEKHIPSSFLKSTFWEVWEKEYNLLDQTCSHKFRDFKTDVNQWIMREWQIASGKFEPRSIRAGKLLSIHNESEAEIAAAFIKAQREPMVCINDHVEGDFHFMAKTIEEAFETILPYRSGFEKQDIAQ